MDLLLRNIFVFCLLYLLRTVCLAMRIEVNILSSAPIVRPKQRKGVVHVYAATRCTAVRTRVYSSIALLRVY